jgi:type III pantothenate kinase
MIAAMLLAANVGNSSVKVARADREGRLGPVTRLPTRVTADVLVDDLRASDVALDDVRLVALVSVVPSYRLAFAALAADVGVPLFDATAATIPIEARVDARAAVGVDRLLNAYAAARLHGAPAIVVDFGTATTVTAVDAGGAYAGGAIAPGLVLGLDALATRTAALPLVEAAWPDRVVARNTADAMRSGAVVGHLGAVRELVTRTRQELDHGATSGARPRLILAGGLAAMPWWDDLRADVIDPDLTLRGLVRLAVEQPAGIAA